MKNRLLLIIVILLFGCKLNKSTSKSISVQIDEDGIYLVKDSIEKTDKQQFGFEAEKEKIFKENLSGNCLFDQAKQTDEFLKGIKEFEGYVWNQETKIATIKLSDGETLKIHRGGCDYYEVFALFRIEEVNLSYPEDEEFIFKKVLWVANLIEDFRDIGINDLLKVRQFYVINGHNNTTLELLKFEDLVKMSVWISNNASYSEIGLIWRIN